MQRHRQKFLPAASLTMMPVPVDPSDTLAEILREILALTRREAGSGDSNLEQSDADEVRDREEPERND